MSSQKDRESAEWFNHAGAELMRKLGVKPGHRVLDFGCGIGGYVLPLAGTVAPDGEIIAVDKRAGNLQELKNRLAQCEHAGRVTIRETDGRLRLPWIKNDSLDAVFVFDVLHVIEDWHELFTEMRRILRRDRMLFVNPASLSHKGEVDVTALMTVLETCGFIFDYSLMAKAWHYHQPSIEEIFAFRTG